MPWAIRPKKRSFKRSGIALRRTLRHRSGFFRASEGRWRSVDGYRFCGGCCGHCPRNPTAIPCPEGRWQTGLPLPQPARCNRLRGRAEYALLTGTPAARRAARSPCRKQGLPPMTQLSSRAARFSSGSPRSRPARRRSRWSPSELWAIEPIERHGGAKFKFSVAAYSYRDCSPARLRNSSSKISSTIARRCTLEGTELTSYYFPPDVSPDYLRQIKNLTFRLGLDISGTAGGQRLLLVRPGPSARSRSPWSNAGSTMQKSSALR